MERMEQSGGIREGDGEPAGAGRYIRPVRRKLSDAPGRFLSVATWNVRAAVLEIDQQNLLDDLSKNGVDIACVQELKCGAMSPFVDMGKYECFLFPGSLWQHAGGLGFFIKKGSKVKIQAEPKLVDKRIAICEVKIGVQRVTIVNCYAPHSGSGLAEERKRFWNKLNQELGRIRGNVYVCGDFNAELPQLGEEDTGEDGVTGNFAPNFLKESENSGLLRTIMQEGGFRDCLSRMQIRWNRRWTFRGNWAHGRQCKELDHIFFNHGCRPPLRTVTKRTTRHNSDHKMVIATFTASWQSKNPSVQQLKEKARRVMRTPNAAAALQADLANEDEKTMAKLENIIAKVAQNSETSAPTKQKPWISDETMQLIVQRMKANTEKSKATWTKKIRRSARVDRHKWSREQLDEMKQAHNLGDTKRLYKTLRAMGGVKPRNDMIYPNEQPKFQKFNEELFQEREHEEIASEAHRNTAAWKLSEAKLDEVADDVWRVNTDTPSHEEFMNAVGKLKLGKSCAGWIPAELVKNSKPVRDIIFDTLTKAWQGDDADYEWATAEIKLLHKKGPKGEPENYRPIALLTIIENLLSSIIYARMVTVAASKIDPRQVGFLPGKSGRAAVYKITRSIKEANAKKTKKIMIFVDFEKAFDSLLHKTMFATLRNSGCPGDLLKPIERIYDAASLELKYGNGENSAAIRQRRGIRQGSALSPLLFILCLDWALKRVAEAMEREGYDESKWDWEAFADDIDLEANDENSAQFLLWQLEAACLFLGLRISVSKSKVMPINIAIKRTEKEKCMMQHVTIREGKLLPGGSGKQPLQAIAQNDAVMEGVRVDFNAIQKYLPKLDAQRILEDEEATKRATHVIKAQFHDGEGLTWKAAETANKIGGFRVHMGLNLWKYYTVNNLAYRRYVKDAHNKHVCGGCAQLFLTMTQLKCHHISKTCPKQDCRTMPLEWQLFRGRQQGVWANNRLISTGQQVETIDIQTISGNTLECVGKFKYLGTTVTQDGQLDTEMKIRCDIARGKTLELKKVWKSRILSAKIKAKFFNTLIASVLFYNVETWALSPRNKINLRKEHAKMAKTAFQKGRLVGTVGKMETNEYFLARYKLDTVDQILARRKATWVAHVLRGNDENAKKTLREAESENNYWWKAYVAELGIFGCTPEDVKEKAQSRAEIRKLFNKQVPNQQQEENS